jgi:hypothetical protein
MEVDGRAGVVDAMVAGLKISSGSEGSTRNVSKIS